MIPKLLTTSDVARMKGRSRTAVYNAMNNGTLPFTYVLGRRAVKETDAKQWNPTGQKTGRPKGTPVSSKTKAQISQSQKKRWANRKEETPSAKPARDGTKASVSKTITRTSRSRRSG